MPFHRPSELVHEPVVEAADQQEVVQVGSTAVPPPDDVVGLREPTGTAAREAALAIAVPDLPDHPVRGLPRHPTDSDDVSVLVLDHRLHARVA